MRWRMLVPIRRGYEISLWFSIFRGILTLGCYLSVGSEDLLANFHPFAFAFYLSAQLPEVLTGVLAGFRM